MNNIDELEWKNLFKKYLHDIRNLKKIDKEIINNIFNLSTNKEKMEIIITLHDTLEYLITYIDE